MARAEMSGVDPVTNSSGVLPASRVSALDVNRRIVVHQMAQ